MFLCFLSAQVTTLFTGRTATQIPAHIMAKPSAMKGIHVTCIICGLVVLVLVIFHFVQPSVRHYTTNGAIIALSDQRPSGLLSRIALRCRAPSSGEYGSIPAVCHQTWETTQVPPHAVNAVQQSKANNPDISFRLYGDSDCHNYIAQHMPPEVLRAYSRINPKYGAARADFFRYVVMAVEGGIYLDIKSTLKPNAMRHIQPGVRCILDTPQRSLEKYRVQTGYATHEQWLLIAEPRHPYFIRAVYMLTRDVFGDDVPNAMRMMLSNSTDAKQMVLRSTGPDFLALAIHAAITLEGPAHSIIPYNKLARYVYAQKKNHILSQHYSRVNLAKHPLRIK